LETIESCLMF